MKLSFPFQKKPNKEDIEQWSYFIQQISSNGHLFVPLGQWVWTPDQMFPHVINTDQKTIYARDTENWKVFTRKSIQSRWFLPVRLVVQSLPLSYKPVQVVRMARYLIAFDEKDIRTQTVPAAVP